MKSSTIRVLLGLFFAAGMLFYVQRILIPYQKQDAAAHDRPRGNLSDLYPRWLGARELLVNGRDPYSADITREIQIGVYGRPLDPSRPGDPTDQQAFAYPVYVVFLLAPTITLPFSIVQNAFFWFLLLVVLASVPMWLVFLGWRPSAGTFVTLLLLTAGSYPVIQGLKLQQLSVLVMGFIALSCALISRDYFVPAGILMAFSLIKPQLAAPVAGWLVLWSWSDWTNRRRYMLSFGTTFLALLAGSEWVLPGWIARFRDAVVAYRVYTGNIGSVLDSLLGPGVGRMAALLVVLGVLFFCWRARKFSAAASQFSSVTCLVLTATIVIVPSIAPYNQVLLLPAILLLAWHVEKLVHASLPVRAVVIAAGILVAWQWISACALMLLAVALPANQVQQWWTVPLFSSLLIPIAVLFGVWNSIRRESVPAPSLP